MKNVYLIRTSTNNQGTKGTLITNGFICRTLELPWNDNKRSISCIPKGEYLTKIRYSKKYKKIYWVNQIPNRSWILLHSGNYAGCTKKGYKSHSEGCILLGKKFGILGNQQAILTSRVTLKKFMIHMNYEPFKLHIIGGY